MKDIKKWIMIGLSIAIFITLLLGILGLANKDRNKPILEDESPNIINDRYTSGIEESKSVELGDACKEGAIVKIENAEVVLNKVLGVDSAKALGIQGTPKKIINIFHSLYSQYIAILTEEGAVYINVIAPDEGACDTAEANIKKWATFTKIETDSKVLDIISRHPLIGGERYGGEELYIYLETNELRLVELKYNKNATYERPDYITIGKRWGELYPYKDVTWFYVDNEEEQKYTLYTMFIYDDKSIKINKEEEGQTSSNKEDILFSNKKIKVKYIYTDRQYDYAKEIDKMPENIYIVDESNTLYSIKISSLNFEVYNSLTKIDIYDKIEKKEDGKLILTKGTENKTIITEDFYEYIKEI